MIITLYHQDGKEVLHLEVKRILIGRTGGDVLLNRDKYVSGKHAQLTEMNDGQDYHLEDLNSTHGTFINDERLTPFHSRKLKPSDQIRIGQTILEIEFPSSSGSRNNDEQLTPLIDGGRLDSVVPIHKIPTELPTSDMEEMLETSQHRLKLFYRMSEIMGSIYSAEELAKVIVNHVYQAIKDAEACGLLLRQADDRFVLAAYTSQSNFNYFYSTTLAERSLEEAFIWRSDQNQVASLEHVQAAIYVPLAWRGEVHGVLFVINTEDPRTFTPEDQAVLTALATQSAMFIKNYALQVALRQEEVKRSTLQSHFSPQIAEYLLQHPEEMQPGSGQVSDPVTVLVSDVRGFTASTKHMSPDQVMYMLNEMFNALSPVILNYQGSIDKYIGDGILAVFGSPRPDRNQCLHAVQAALAMQEAMQNIAAKTQEEFGLVMQIGIAVHTGRLMHGFLGSDDRLEYTIIGDTVNDTARLCDNAERNEIIISETVFEQVESYFVVEPRRVKSQKHAGSEAHIEAMRAYTVIQAK